MKKIAAFVLVLVLVCGVACSAFAAPAYGIVHVNTYLNLRSGPSTGSGIIAYVQNGTQVKIGDTSISGDFYYIRAYSALDHDTFTTDAKYRNGYGAKAYITVLP